MRRLLIVLAFAAVGCDGSAHEQSCAGRSVGLCAPYEHSLVSSASLTPNELPIADFTMRAQIRVELSRCEMAPAPHVVELTAIVPDDMPSDGGSGEPVRVTSLLTLRDGGDGDPVEGDGVIDVEVVNPLLATIPPERDIILRFTPRSTAPAGCTGQPFDVPYRTGPTREP